jgi:hypothetical protein
MVILIDGGVDHPTRTRRLQIASPRFATTNAHADALAVLQGSVGTKTVTVDLLAGRWKVYSAAGKGVISSFTVTQ